MAGRVGLAVAGHSSHVAAMAGLASCRSRAIYLQAFVSEPIKPFVDHVISFGAELFYISQSDKGGLVFGGHIDGFNSYTQRGQFPEGAERRGVRRGAHALDFATAAAAALGRDSGHDTGRQPIHLSYSGAQSLSQRRLVLPGFQGDACVRAGASRTRLRTMRSIR